MDGTLQRRRLLALLGSTTGSTALAACRVGGGPDGPASSPSNASAALVMHARAGDESTHFTERGTAFQAANPQLSVTVEPAAGNEFATKLTALQAAGSLGDALWANQVGPFFPLAATGATRRLDDLAKRDKYDLGQHIPATVEQLRWKGNLHGLPWLVHAGWSGLYINEDAWKQAGQVVPTWDWTYENEFRAAGRRLTRQVGDSTDVFGYEIPYVMQAAITFLRSWGTDLLSADGKQSLLSEPKAISALTFAHDLMNTQQIAPRPDRAVPMAFQTGKSLSWVTGYFSSGPLRQQVRGDFAWRAYPMPKGPAGRGAFLGDDAVAQNTASKSPDAAWKWLQFLVSKESGLIVARDRGSPGGRNDVWDDPSLATDPNHQMFREWMKLVKPMAVPANARMTELTDAVNASLRELYLSKKPVPQAIGDIHLAVQRVLDS